MDRVIEKYDRVYIFHRTDKPWDLLLDCFDSKVRRPISHLAWETAEHLRLTGGQLRIQVERVDHFFDIDETQVTPVSSDTIHPHHI